MWRQSQASTSTAPSLMTMFRGPLLVTTLVITLMNACTMFAWWGFNLWIPAYLSLSVEGGGIGLTAVSMSWFIVAMQVGMWFGYVTFGFISDAVGRRRTYVTYLLTAAVLMFTYASLREPWMLLVLGPFVAFFGTGYFSGFGAVTAELYPTAIRATAQGLTYNAGRIVSAAAPFMLGSVAQSRGFGFAFGMAAAAFVAAAVVLDCHPRDEGSGAGVAA